MPRFFRCKPAASPQSVSVPRYAGFKRALMSHGVAAACALVEQTVSRMLAAALGEFAAHWARLVLPLLGAAGRQGEVHRCSFSVRSKVRAQVEISPTLFGSRAHRSRYNQHCLSAYPALVVTTRPLALRTTIDSSVFLLWDAGDRAKEKVGTRIFFLASSD